MGGYVSDSAGDLQAEKAPVLWLQCAFFCSATHIMQRLSWSLEPSLLGMLVI
jgi:hypothetical protein